jgi:hypothetical protein
VDRDLTFPEIEKTFLDFVERFHAEHDYERDFLKIARERDIRVHPSQQNQSFSIGEERIILLVIGHRNKTVLLRMEQKFVA